MLIGTLKSAELELCRPFIQSMVILKFILKTCLLLSCCFVAQRRSTQKCAHPVSFPILSLGTYMGFKSGVPSMGCDEKGRSNGCSHFSRKKKGIGSSLS